MRSSLYRYIMLFKRWAWVMILGIVICGGSTYIVTKLFIKPVYQSQALILVNVTAGGSMTDNTTASLAMIPTLVQQVNSPTVIRDAQAKHPELTVQQLSQMVSAKQYQSNTAIIEVDVLNSDPAGAATIANDVANSFISFANGNLGGTMQLTVYSVSQPISPYAPKPSQDAALGAAAGLGLALALVIIFEWIDDRLTSPEEVNTLLGTELLTVIPELSRQQRTKNAEETPQLAEGCRVLCANLNMAQVVRPFKLVMVTSALAGEGKSTIAANIATFLAMSGKRVLLVDADLRHPVLDQHFQLDNRQGLSNAFLEMWAQVEVGLDGQPTEIPSLRVLTAGVLPSNPSELLQSQLAYQLFNHFRNSQKFDYIIFDTPPVLPVADTQILASYIQVTILVADASKTPRRALVRAKQALARTGTRILGVALNKSQWPDFGEVHDYLSNMSGRPRADITMTAPPNGPAMNRAVEATNTAMMPKR
ncbi:MAG TPA: polysaccharide biosynthesis tyrosine autokinase [Ktedonobacteraceae bacterium]|nr:polysaccharide biosynthesis tyrosine autokinase [Ktedonobacteraceae bacterium]